MQWPARTPPLLQRCTSALPLKLVQYNHPPASSTTGFIEIDLACLAPDAPSAALEAMPTALKCCAAAGHSRPHEPATSVAGSSDIGAGGGGSGTAGSGSRSGPWLDHCNVSRPAQKSEAEIKAARTAFLHWISANSGQLAVVHKGGGVNARFRLNKQHPDVCAANGGWHTVAITLPAKQQFSKAVVRCYWGC